MVQAAQAACGWLICSLPHAVEVACSQKYRFHVTSKYLWEHKSKIRPVIEKQHGCIAMLMTPLTTFVNIIVQTVSVEWVQL